MINAGSIETLYSKCEAQRSSYLERGRDSSRLTVPTILPDDGDRSSKKFPTPYQSVGARGVNNLSSALLLSLLPPNAPFFRLVIDEAEKKKMAAIDPRIQTEVETSLSDIERAVSREIEVNSIRVATFEALRHLVVTGNALLYMPDKGAMRVIHLDRYIVKRYPMGNAQCIIMKETVSPAMLPEELRDYVKSTLADYEDTCEVFTKQEILPDGKVEVVQEVKGKIIEETYKVFPKDRSPFIALRMMRVDGEDYGRGYVEQYYGDLLALENLYKAILEASASLSKVLFLCNPNGTTRPRTLSQASNGSIVQGNAADVTVLQAAGKSQDLQIANQTIERIENRLAFAFIYKWQENLLCSVSGRQNASS